ncbi:hypothetical protein ACFX2I_031573 [Malus domestica]
MFCHEFMAAHRKESEGMKLRESVSIGEYQVVFGLAAKRDEPGEIVVAAETMAERRETTEKGNKGYQFIGQRGYWVSVHPLVLGWANG